MEMAKMPTPRFSFTNRYSATNKVPRLINRNLIFNQIRTRQPISRADLARASGLQRSTVSLIVEELIADRWVVEGSLGRLPRGRRPTFLNLNGKRVVLALDIHPSQTTLAVTDLGGQIVKQNVIELPVNPQKVLGAIVNAIRNQPAWPFRSSTGEIHLRAQHIVAHRAHQIPRGTGHRPTRCS
jgi:hypothetical protein